MIKSCTDLCGYKVVQLDCIGTGGGIALYILNSILVKVLLSGPNSLEFLAVSLSSTGSTSKHCIALLYCLYHFLKFLVNSSVLAKSFLINLYS